MGRKKRTPSVSASAASSLEREPQEKMTEADRAHAHAAEMCDRIIRELDEILSGGHE